MIVTTASIIFFSFALSNSLINPSPITSTVDDEKGKHHHQIQSRKFSDYDYNLQAAPSTTSPPFDFGSIMKMFSQKSGQEHEDQRIESRNAMIRVCAPGHYECQLLLQNGNATCVPIGSVCDGHPDCPLSDDEVDELCGKDKKHDERSTVVNNIQVSDQSMEDNVSNTSNEFIPRPVQMIMESSMAMKEKMMDSAMRIHNSSADLSAKRKFKIHTESDVHPITLINFGSMIIGDRNVAGSSNHIGNGNGNGNHNEEPQETSKNYTEKMKEDL